MRPWLDLYPSREKALLLIEGFSFGFPLPSFTGSGCTIVDNLKSVRQFPEVVREKVSKEIAEGRMAGPFKFPPFSDFRISPLGVVPKREPNSFSLIQHLSFPKGGSLNDEIDDSLCSVAYATFDEAVGKIKACGRGALLAKADVKSAFRLLPIAPAAFSSLGFYFDGFYFFDKCLPMGCSLSCTYFETFSTFIHWVMCFESGQDSIAHYLDEFLFIGSANSDICSRLLQLFVVVTEHFGVPLAAEKTCYPATSMEFLGILIDTEVEEFSLPQAKVDKMRNLIAVFLRRRKVLLKEMQSLLGLLAFAGKIMPVGRIFSRRLYMATAGLKSPFAHIRLTASLKDDLVVWADFLATFNGRSFFQSDFIFAPDFRLFTDAAGSKGFAAIWGSHWSCGAWPEAWIRMKATRNVVLLELFPVLVAVALWGEFFANRRILVETDNKGVLFAVNCLSSSSLWVVKILRHLVFLCLKFNIWIKAKYTPGVLNNLADSLSRFQMQRFRELLPGADAEGTQCPAYLWELI